MAKQVNLTKVLLEELVKATGVKMTARTKVDSAFLEDLAAAVNELSDADWGNLSDDARGWYNQTCDLVDAGDEIPGVVEEKAPAADKAAGGRGRGRGKAEPEPEPEEEEEEQDDGKVVIDFADVAEGDKVTVVCGDEEFEGTVAKKTTRSLSLKVGRKTEDFKKSEITEILGDAPAQQEEEQEEEQEAETETVLTEVTDPTTLKAGDKVQCKIENDEFSGSVVELTKKGRKVVGMVLEIEGEQEDISFEDFVFDEGDFIKVETEVVKEAKKADAGGRGRGRGRGRPADTPEEKEEKAGERAARGGRGSTRNAAGAKSDGGRATNSTQRVRDIIASNLEASLTEVQKTVEKEGLEIKSSTLGVVYSDFHKTVEALRGAGHME